MLPLATILHYCYSARCMHKEYVSSKLNKKAHRVLKDVAHHIEQSNGRYGLIDLFDAIAEQGREAIIKFVKGK